MRIAQPFVQGLHARRTGLIVVGGATTHRASSLAVALCTSPVACSHVNSVMLLFLSAGPPAGAALTSWLAETDRGVGPLVESPTTIPDDCA